MNIKNQLVKITFAFILALASFSCTDEDKQEITKLPTIVEIAKSDDNYSVLVKALEVCGIANTFSAPGSFTVFAPDNAAFASLTPAVTMASLSALNPNVAADVLIINNIRRVVQNHVIGLAYKSEDLIPSSTNGYYKTFALGVGTNTQLSMFVNNPSGTILINGGTPNGGAEVIKADVIASNGIIHFVNKVIGLPTLVNHVIANPDLSILKTIVTSGVGGAYGDQSLVLADLVAATASPTSAALTVFAPLNSAFVTATTGSGFYTGAIVTPANTSKLLRYHLTKVYSHQNTTTALPPVTTTFNNTGNFAALNATSFLIATASGDATFTTLALPAATQKFLITNKTVKITELPAIPLLAPSNIKTVNIQATNGVIHTIDRVLQPI